MYKQFLAEPPISTFYKDMRDATQEERIKAANVFLASMEYGVLLSSNIAMFDTVENVLKSKVLTYAIAFAGGATNGGALYQKARADLLTWRAIFEGATFVNGWLK